MAVRYMAVRYMAVRYMAVRYMAVRYMAVRYMAVMYMGHTDKFYLLQHFKARNLAKLKAVMYQTTCR